MDLMPTGLINSLGKAIKKVLGMRPNSLQLLEPNITRGQDEAVVDEVIPVEETLAFDPCPWGVCEIGLDGTVTRVTASNDAAVEESTEPDIPEPEIIRKVLYTSDPDSRLRYVA